jgi:hypothetical protein
MTASLPHETTNLATLYDQDEMPWSRAVAALGSGSLGPETAAFLCTVGRDGRPHAAGIGVAVHDGTPYFTSGPGRAKARNLARNPACTLALRLDGLDLSLEGTAVRVTDRATLDAVVAAYREGGWPAAVEGDAITAEYSAQSAGPPPWHLFRLDVEQAVGVGTREPSGASRWRF